MQQWIVGLCGNPLTRRCSLGIVLLTMLGLGLSGLFAAAPSAAQPGPRSAGPQAVPDEALVQFRPGVPESEKGAARARANAVREEVIRTGPAGDLELLKLPPGLAVADAVRSLQAHSAVAFAEPNWIYVHQDASNDPYYTNGSLWGMYGDTSTPAGQYGSQAAEAWAAGYTGNSDVYIGVIDEGIQFDHPDLQGQVWTNPFDSVDGIDNDGNGRVDDSHGWDFYSNNNSIYDGTGDDHGTHVSGTIAGIGGNGQGVAGVNWKVTLISAKFLGPNGGSLANAVKAVDYLTDLKTRHGLNIVATSNSWGGGGYSQALHDAIIRAANQNILFVAAAGNNGTNNDTTAQYPSNYNTSVGTSTQAKAGYDAVIAVAAIDSKGALASWSDYGAKTVDLGAPGVGVSSTVPTNGYGSYSGTSMATPHVTGAVALYASTHPGASAAEIKAAIVDNVTPTASLSGTTATGGRLNVSKLMGTDGGSIAGPATSTPTPDPGATNTPVPTSTSTPTPSTFTLSVTRNGRGTVTSSDGGINCGFDCSQSYPSGSSVQVTLSATGTNNTVFAGWSGACSGSAPTCTVGMNQNQSVTARFARR